MESSTLNFPLRGKQHCQVFLVKTTSMKEKRNQKKLRLGLRHDRHTVSLQTDHMVFCSKYRRPVLIGDIAKRCEEVIRSVAKDMDIKIIRKIANRLRTFTDVLDCLIILSLMTAAVSNPMIL